MKMEMAATQKTAGRISMENGISLMNRDIWQRDGLTGMGNSITVTHRLDRCLLTVRLLTAPKSVPTELGYLKDGSYLHGLHIAVRF